MGWETTASPGTRTNATGLTSVKTYLPTPYDEPADGPKLVRISLTEAFTGDIIATGVAEALQVERPDGTASLVGVERVVGKVGDRSGSFVFLVQGMLLAGKTLSGAWSVVAGSGTLELTGLRGEGGFIAKLGQYGKVTLDYWFE